MLQRKPYLYYRLKQEQTKPNDVLLSKYQEVMKVNKIFASFCQNEIGGKDIGEIRTKLNGRKLVEILEELQDYETEVDTLRRSKNELEANLLAQSNSFQSLIKEKESLLKTSQNKLNETLRSKVELQEIIKRLEKEKKDLQEFSQKQVEELNKKLEGLKEKSRKDD